MARWLALFGAFLIAACTVIDTSLGGPAYEYELLHDAGVSCNGHEPTSFYEGKDVATAVRCAYDLPVALTTDPSSPLIVTTVMVNGEYDVGGYKPSAGACGADYGWYLAGPRATIMLCPASCRAAEAPDAFVWIDVFASCSTEN